LSYCETWRPLRSRTALSLMGYVLPLH